MTPLPTATKHGLWVLLGTMLRVGELCGSLRCYIDLQRREWRLPPELLKAKAEHVVYLSDFVIEHLRALFALTDSPWTLPHPNDARQPMPPELLFKPIGDRQPSMSVRTLKTKPSPTWTSTISSSTVLTSKNPTSMLRFGCFAWASYVKRAAPSSTPTRCCPNSTMPSRLKF
jgi:hypothetical protein